MKLLLFLVVVTLLSFVYDFISQLYKRTKKHKVVFYSIIRVTQTYARTSLSMMMFIVELYKKIKKC